MFPTFYWARAASQAGRSVLCSMLLIALTTTSIWLCLSCPSVPQWLSVCLCLVFMTAFVANLAERERAVQKCKTK